MPKLHPILIFTSLLMFFLTGSFFTHQFYLNAVGSPYLFNDLFGPYVVNFVLTFSITLILYSLRIKQAHNLGFIFMGSSFVKFAVFFLVFFPIYKEDGVASKMEIAQFFVPYAVALTVETVFLIQIMNKLELPIDN